MNLHVVHTAAPMRQERAFDVDAERVRSARFVEPVPHCRKAAQPSDQCRDRVGDVRRLECGNANARQRSRDHLPLVVGRANEVDAEAPVDLEVDEAGGEYPAVERDVVDRTPAVGLR